MEDKRLPPPIPRRPLAWWWWIIIGAALGVALRILFGALPADLRGPMSLAFLVGVPVVVGALTVLGAPPERRTPLFLVFGPWLTIGLMFIGCAVALLEGSICLALMAPLYLAVASLSGLLTGVVLHFAGNASASKLRAVAVLPLLMILGEAHVPLPEHEMELRREVMVDAAPAVIWQQIHTARAIKAEELPLSLTHLIGVPKPLEGVNILTEDGEVRFSRWERGVNFRAVVIGQRKNEWVSWHYLFDDTSFPRGSMDEHVAIGGRYFDLRDTTFRLVPEAEGRTRLQIVAHYRLATSVNFYAVPVSRLLGEDFLDTVLGLYKRRSEAAARAGQGAPGYAAR